MCLFFLSGLSCSLLSWRWTGTSSASPATALRWPPWRKFSSGSQRAEDWGVNFNNLNIAQRRMKLFLACWLAEDVHLLAFCPRRHELQLPKHFPSLASLAQLDGCCCGNWHEIASVLNCETTIDATPGAVFAKIFFFFASNILQSCSKPVNRPPDELAYLYHRIYFSLCCFAVTVTQNLSNFT